MTPKPAKRITSALMGQPWAITEGYLQLMLQIAARQNLDVEAVERQLGRRLENTQTVQERAGVAIIPVTGPIFRYANLFAAVSGATSIQTLARDFSVALNNPDVRAILLNIDSPGGEANGVAEFAEMVYQARGTKPIWAYVGGTGASAAYWIASTADRIVAHETAMLGSIGVIAAIPTDEEGEITFVSAQSPRKAMNPETDEGKQDIQYVLDTLAQHFVETVARNRGVTADTVLADFGQGAVLIGKDAVAAGLADRLGTFEATLAELARGKSEATQTVAAAAPRIQVHVAPGVPAASLDAAVTARIRGEKTFVGDHLLGSAPIAAGGPRADTATQPKETPRMAEEQLDQQAPPADALPPLQPPAISAADPAVQAQVNAVVAQMTAQFEQQRQIVLEQAQAQFQRQLAEMQAQQAIQAFAQDATTATINRRHALPFTAAEIGALLTETPAPLRGKWQAALSKINESGLVPFDEIGSAAEGAPEPSAREQFDAAVNAKVALGMSKLSAMQAVGREQPELYRQYQAESRTHVAAASRKGGK